LAVGRVGSTTDLVTQKFVRVEEQDKHGILLDLIISIKGLTIVFVETKRKADILEDFLIREGFQANSIHGDKVQEDRTAALKAFASGQNPILIATNVAARGLDIDNITHVINYDMPTDITDYVHRIGRTGRRQPGLATSFVNQENGNIVPKLLKILLDSQQEIPEWLENMKSLGRGGYSGYGNHNREGGRGSKFGGKDYRSEKGVEKYESPGRSVGGWGSNGGSYGSNYGGGGNYGESSGGGGWW